MKRSLAIAVGAVVLLAAGSPWAQDSKAPMPNATAAAPSSGSSVDMSSQMDEHTQMMKALHEKMMRTATPVARQIVMEMMMQTMMDRQGMMSGTKSADATPKK